MPKSASDYYGLGIGMNLDRRTCSRARLSRDPRFDGKFFIGVITTRIYCRSICRAPTAKEKNVRYFATAAAAAEAGFRPCLRCRPECSPGTPAWLGTPATVSRALRLIEESGLDDGGVERLAERLGVTSRHLRRLFLRHVGATPGAVARTRRLHFAKTLITETGLPMTQIALASGFGSIRRFNADIRRVYHRAPTGIRRLARRMPALGEDQYFLQLEFRPPYDWRGMVNFLAERATPGVEAVAGDRYRRTILLDGHPGFFEVFPGATPHAIAVRVQFPNPRLLFHIVQRIRAMFDLNADWDAIAVSLRADPDLCRAMEARPGLRVPGCWDGFELGARAVLGHGLCGPAARELAMRFVRALGTEVSFGDGLTHFFPSPEAAAEANLSIIGIPAGRAEPLRNLARAVRDGVLRFGGVPEGKEFLARLRQIPGLAGEVAEYVVMRALNEPDAFPAEDATLLRATCAAGPSELEQRAEAWRPWRAYAAMYLWTLAPSDGTRAAAGQHTGATNRESARAPW